MELAGARKAEICSCGLAISASNYSTSVVSRGVAKVALDVNSTSIILSARKATLSRESFCLQNCAHAGWQPLKK